MAQIHNDQQVYALLGRLFESVVADEDIGPRLHAVDAIVQQQFRRPDAKVTLKLLAGEEREVITGDTELRPEVVLVMDAATGHRVWIGELSAMVALSKGQIRARGPVAKILRLIDLVALVAPRYREQLDALVAPAEADVASNGAVEGDAGDATTADAETVTEESETPAEEAHAPADEAEAAAEDAEPPAEDAEAATGQAEAPEAAAEEAPAAEEEPADEPESPAEEPAAEEPAAEEPAAEEPGDGDTQAA